MIWGSISEAAHIPAVAPLDLGESRDELRDPPLHPHQEVAPGRHRAGGGPKVLHETDCLRGIQRLHRTIWASARRESVREAASLWCHSRVPFKSGNRSSRISSTALTRSIAS